MKMKLAKKITSCLTAFVITMLFYNAFASEYLGEYCWRNEDNEIIRFAVTHIDGVHYSFDGYNIGSEEGQIEPTNGNGVLVGDKIYATFSHTCGTSYGSNGAIVRAILDLPTMSFSYELFSIYQQSGNIEVEYGAETAQFITCP